MNRRLEKYSAELRGSYSAARLQKYALLINERFEKLLSCDSGGGNQNAGRNRKQKH